MKNLRLIALLIISSFVLVIQASPSAAQATTAPNISQFRFVDVASGFSRPLYVTHAADDRLFVVEQDGRIKIIQNGAVNPTAGRSKGCLVWPSTRTTLKTAGSSSITPIRQGIRSSPVTPYRLTRIWPIAPAPAPC
jgi:hypothetical protein